MTAEVRSQWSGWDPLWRRGWEELLSRPQGEGPPALAAFDADGTLWADDAGEAMLRMFAREGGLPGRTEDDILEEYNARVEADVSAGYAWAVTVMAGGTETGVQALARRTMDSFLPSRLFPAMASLVRNLHAHPAWEVVIVSASNRWIVEAGVAVLGLASTQVMGIQMEVHDGVLGETLQLPLTNGVGKVEALQKRYGRPPALAMGNSMHDAPMLAAATERAVAINPSHELHARAIAESWGMCMLKKGGARHD